MRNLLFVLFTSCIVLNTLAQTPKQTVNRALPVIDITKEYPQKKKLVLQDIATVEYIPLETTDKVLLDNVASLHSSISDHYIVTYNSKESTIFVFDRTGKIKYHFNRRGGSGEEYADLRNLRIDEKAKELYVLDYTGKVKVYSLDGKYKRSLTVPQDIRIEQMYNYDDQWLMCYDSYNLDRTGKVANSRPYFLLSKKDGTISRLPVTIKDRIGNRIYIQKGEQMAVSSIAIFPLISNGTEIILSDLAGDTVYSYKNKKLTPLFVRSPKSTATDPRLMLSCNLKVGNYLFMSSLPKKVFEQSSDISSKSFVFDLSTRTPCDISIVNKDFLPERSMRSMNDYVQLPENCVFDSYDADWLLKAYNGGKLTGKLKQIASKMTEDDNPVFVLYKFK